MDIVQKQQQSTEEVEPLSPCIYFLTQRHLYVTVFRWQNVRNWQGKVKERDQWKVEFISPLLEIPMTGEEIFHLVDNVTEGRDILFVPEHYNPTGLLGRPLRAKPTDSLDIHRIILIRPSRVSKAIEELLAIYGPLWFDRALDLHQFHQEPPVPQPSIEAQKNDEGEPLFDVYIINKAFTLLSSNELFVRLTYAQSLKLAQSLIDEGRPDDMILRYFEGDALLQWVNAVYSDVGAIPEFGYDPTIPL